MPTFALLDVVSPYVLGGAAIGQPMHELLSALFVTEIETSFDDNGVCVSGMARFSADVDNLVPIYRPPATITWNPSLTVDHATQRTAGAYWELPDIAIGFRLTAPRVSSPVADLVVSGGPGGNPAPLNNAAVAALLTGLGQGTPAPGQPAADGPGTVFHMDLLLDLATLHLPFLRGALLQPDGMLEPDPVNTEVTVTFPKIKLSLFQTAGAAGIDPQMSIRLDSFAASDINDPAGAGYAELISMKPPYALLGPESVVGLGFHSVILDLSGTQTPPQLLDKFGIGAEFRGLYFPDVRFFLKTSLFDGLNFDVSAREAVIALGPDGGVSGVFGIDIVHPDNPPSGTITIYDQFGGLVRRLEIPAAAPGGPIPLVTTERVLAPRKSQWVVNVVGGQPPYNISTRGQQQISQPVPVEFAQSEQAKTVRIEIVDVHQGGRNRSIDVPIALQPLSLTAPDGGVLTIDKAAVPIVLAEAPPGYKIGFLDFPAQEKVTILVAPPNAAIAVTSGGNPVSADFSGGRASVDLKHGAQIEIEATWTLPPGEVNETRTFTAHFQYDQPLEKLGVDNPNRVARERFANDTGRIQTGVSPDEPNSEAPFLPPSEPLIESAELAEFLRFANRPNAAITLRGQASIDKRNPQRNNKLSADRILVIDALLRQRLGPNPNIVQIPEGEEPEGGAPGQPGRGRFRQVIGTVSAPTPTPADSYRSRLRLVRPARSPTPQPIFPKVIPRQAPGNDMWRFKEGHLRIQVDRNVPIVVEVRLKIDVTTVLEGYLSRVKQQANPNDGGSPTRLAVGRISDPNDGVVDIRIQTSLDQTTDRWQIKASMFEQDGDGFLQTPPPTDVATGAVQQNYWRDYFGVLIAIAPLTDAIAASNSAPGTLVALSMQAAVPLWTAASGIVRVPRITFYGGEIVTNIQDGQATGAILLDVEVALVVSFGFGSTRLIDTDPLNPITVRYKAIGAKTSTRPQLRDLVPVFDSSKGYAINIPSTGGIRVPAPLGDILQVAGTRISRSNPVNIELDLEIKADLGVVSIDRTTIRIPLESGHAPTISALGVHIDIAGVIEGGGYLAIYEDGFAGQIDVSLAGLGIRIAAGLSIRNVSDPNDPARKATAVLITLEIDFPVPIALGSSGLGIYGFGGLFALHHRRNENPSDPVPALDWLTRVDGNPTDIRGWEPQIDNWAIGLGAVLGTMDAGFIINVKGMLIFEMPGPRLLFVMKAKLLSIRPPREGNPTATILAVIDLDLGRNRITIALSLDYSVKPMLSIHVPVRAIFPFDDLTNFAIDAGTWYAPAEVTFFEIFKARGYFMIRGRGIPDQGPANYDGNANKPFPLMPLGGFSIATGVSVSFTWGDTDWGLYIEVGASADFGIGFAPIVFTGEIRIWGELHLWVVSIEAYARLAVVAGQVADGPPIPDPQNPGQVIQPTRNVVQIDGEVYGKVDCFFFDVEGSVHVTLGSKPDAVLMPPPVVTGVSLQSRAEALLMGVSSDRPIDGKLVDARADGSEIADADAVPIDSIIVIHFDCVPRMDGAFAFGQPAPDNPALAVEKPLAPHPTGPTTPAVKRGETFYTYRIRRVSLDHTLTGGEVPFVWWPGVPHPTSESKCELALLTRVPDPHPSAVERSRHAEEILTQQWETICSPTAPPAPVMWTFHDMPLGPSANGWTLHGTASPDAAGSQRRSPPNLRLDVAEIWRSGDLLADLNANIAPARVIGRFVECPEGCDGSRRIQKLGTLRSAPAIVPRLSELITARSMSPAAFEAVEVAPASGRMLAAYQSISTKCHARALEAPFRRPLSPSQLSDHPLGYALAELVEKANANADKFDDVVAFSTGPIVRFRALLLIASTTVRNKYLAIRFFDVKGNLIDERAVDGGGEVGRGVSSLDDLPKEWTTPDGPWRCRVLEVAKYFGIGNVWASHQVRAALLVDTKPPAGTAYVQLGLYEVDKLISKGLERPSYMVGIVETLTVAEVERHDRESESKQSWQNEVNGGLNPMPNPPALLTADTEYRVSIEWDYANCDANGGGNLAWTPGPAQVFRFRTDREPLASRQLQIPGENLPKDMPSRLDPWVLATDPGEGERFRFYGEPVRIIFSVDYLLSMFQTYGVELQAKVRAASYRNASPASPGFPLTVAALNDAITAALGGLGVAPNVNPLAGAAIFSPWEDMARNVLERQPCIETSGSAIRHTIADLNLLLEPYTEFVLDIEPVNAAPPPAGEIARPLFRRPFTTSRYANAEAMCAAARVADLTEIPAGDISAILALAGAPAPLSRSQIDDALRSAGLRPLVDTQEPELEIVWGAVGGLQQPRILIVRTPEPLMRTRKMPTTIEPPGQPRLQREVVSMQDAVHLEVVPGPGAAAMTLLAQPGLNIVIALIEQGRGKPISLKLRRHHSAFYGEGDSVADIDLIDLKLDAAIWELV